ncbi:hypothetical protein HanHA300_Chr09g0312501 [Helianthus annuus]|nr:hypothetical protein HanHA300_Chr09g0312501 [Helianthus annuus]
MAYAYYESRQYSPKKKEEEPVSTRKASEKAPIFYHSSDEESDDDSEEIRKLEYYKRKFSPDSDDDNLYFAGKKEEIKERQAAKKKNHKAATVKEKDDSDDENVRVIKKQVKEIPAYKVEKEADAEKMPEKCENCDTMKRHNNKLIHNMNRLKEYYDVLNKAMNQYNKSSSEQAIAMKTLNGAFMTKQKIINKYIEKCEGKLRGIYPTVEGMKAFEEEKSEVKDTGKKHSTDYTKCPPPLEEGYSP